MKKLLFLTVLIASIAVLLAPTLAQEKPNRANGLFAFIGSDNRLYALNRENGQVQQVTNSIAGPCFEHPEFSPDGRYLAFIGDNESEFEVMVVDLATGNEFSLGSWDNLLLKFEWLRDSKTLLYVPNWEANLAKGKPFAPQGIWTINIATGERKLLFPPLNNDPMTVPELSPNGQFLAFHEVSTDVSGESRIGRLIIARTDGSEVVSTNVPAGLHFDWSPESSQIVYDTQFSRQPTNLGLYISNIDGTNQRLLYSREGYSASEPLWSPNGGYIAFQQTEDNAASYNSSVWIINLETYTVVEIPNNTFWNVISWTPDSSAFLAINTESEIGLLPLNGSPPTILGQGRCATWQPLPAVNREIPTSLPNAPSGWGWMNTSQYNDVHAAHVDAELELEKELSFQNWVQDRGWDYASGKILEKAFGSNIEAILDAARSFAFGSRDDTLHNLQRTRNRRIQLETYWNDPKYRYGEYVLVPIDLTDIPLESFPEFWHVWSDWLPDLDAWIDNINDFAWSLPATCFFFPDFDLCQRGRPH